MCCSHYYSQAFNLLLDRTFIMLWSALVLILLSAATAKYHEPHCEQGRSAIVHLFEWRWDDIAEECERFLGPYGFCGVQTSPPNENAVVGDRPWWERYQSVSYKMVTRSGDETSFKNMVEKCNKAHVKIFPDTVINHMTGVSGSGVGTAGSSWDTGALSYPGVPFGSGDFHSNCPSGDGSIHNYGNAAEVRNCRLANLADLDQGKEYVRGKIADYMNHLLDIGVAGFRVDAAKHMWPGDIANIFGRLKGDPFIAQEVIDQGGEAIKAEEYLATGRVTNFKFGLELGKVFRRQNAMKYLSNFGEGWGMWAGNDVLNFVDNHDNQRGHGGAGGVLTHKEPRPYKMATAFMLAHPYGFPRIMSSFSFSTSDQGPPNSGGDIAHVSVNSDLSCGGGWVCEHRWRQIYNMVAFRNIAGTEPVKNWWAGSDYQIAFGRGANAFIVFNLEGFDLDQTLQTGLPQGQYCDVISGNLEGGRCTGTTITVGGDGGAHFHISSSSEDPMVAIHIGAKVGSDARRY